MVIISTEPVNQKSHSADINVDSIWRNSIFLRVYLSTFISNIGDRLVVFILPLWVLNVTQSSFLVSIVNAVITGTTVLLTPFTGTMADRFSRRKLMISADIIRFFTMIGLTLLAFENSLPFFILIILLVVRSLGTSISSPASNAAIVTFVKDEHIEDAVALRQTMNQLVSIIGPLIGGILVSFISYKGIFAIDALTFLISVLVLTTLKFPKDLNLKRKRNFWEDMKDGVKVIVDNTLLKVLLLSAALINILGSSLYLCLQVFVVRDMSLSSVWWGIIFTSSPVGIIIGSLLSRKIKLDKKMVSFSFIFVIVVGVLNIFMGLTVNPWLFTTFYFLSGIAFGMSNVYFGILYRKTVPMEKQGRFFGFLNSILLISTPVGVTLTGLVLESIKSSVFIILIGSLTSLTAFLSYLVIKNKVE